MPLPAEGVVGEHASVLVAAFGHLVLDVIVRLQHPLAEGDDTSAVISIGAGGQAANFAAWASALGAGARFVGSLGDDHAGRLVHEQLRARSVEVVGPTRGRSPIVVSLVGSDAERTLISDRAEAASFHSNDVENGWLTDCDWLHISGYALVEEPLATTAAAVSKIARAQGTPLSIDLSSASLIRRCGIERFRRSLRALAPSIVFANESEYKVIGQGENQWATVVKRGPRGCTVIAAGSTTDFEASATVAVDTTGAGDAFAAGFVIGGPQLALIAAARCVASIGAMP